MPLQRHRRPGAWRRYSPPFNTEWHKTRALLESDCPDSSALPSLKLNCEYIAKTVLVAHES
eukprot:508077-Prymnesium_polylepis.1